MTYLEVVNGVLRRLRESTVSTYNENEYSTMIGDLVNDALDKVQRSHQWSALFDQATITTSASTQNYVLDGMGEMVQILDAINDTSNVRLKQVSIQWMNTQTNMGGSEEGSPYAYTFNGVASDDDPKVDLWPIPDGVYSIKFKVKKQQSNLTDGSTKIIVPAQPVLEFAYAFALRERGEMGGANFNEQYALANSTLSDYISIDAERHPEAQYWTDGSIYRTLRTIHWDY